MHGLGYRVLPLTSGREALNAFTRNPDEFDLVITDMSMPDMTGAQLALALLKIRPDVPIIISTGFSDVHFYKEARSMGVRDVIRKPFDRNLLAGAVRRTLDGGKGGR